MTVIICHPFPKQDEPTCFLVLIIDENKTLVHIQRLAPYERNFHLSFYPPWMYNIVMNTRQGGPYGN